MDSSSTIIALHISSKTYPMTARPHDARPSLLEGIDAAGITLLFSREKALLKLPRLDLPAVSGFVDEQTFDAVVDPAKMVKPRAIVAA